MRPHQPVLQWIEDRLSGPRRVSLPKSGRMLVRGGSGASAEFYPRLEGGDGIRDVLVADQGPQPVPGLRSELGDGYGRRRQGRSGVPGEGDSALEALRGGPESKAMRVCPSPARCPASSWIPCP